MGKSTLHYVHLNTYQDDLPFWEEITEGRDDILELGCGAGRVTLPLAKAGHAMWGMDDHLQGLRLARGKLYRVHPAAQERVRLLMMDMRSFHLNMTFNAVISPCNTYSLFSASGRQSILRSVARHLKRRGIFAVSMPNPHRLREVRESGFKDREVWESVEEGVISHPRTGNPVQIRSRLSPTSQGVKWTWIYDHLQPDGRVQRETFSQSHVLTPVEQYLAEFAQAGFSVATWGNYDRSPFTSSSPTLIIRGELSS